jgi:hypothetical protein
LIGLNESLRTPTELAALMNWLLQDYWKNWFGDNANIMLLIRIIFSSPSIDLPLPSSVFRSCFHRPNSSVRNFTLATAALADAPSVDDAA